MKIWFDILTPKQVMFFRHAVSLLENSGHEVLCTSRDYREAVELANLKGLDLKIVGKHGGAERFDKLRSSASRMFELADVVNQFGPEVAVTFSSPEGARVAFGLGIKHVGFNDSPHAEAVAKLTVPLMDRLMCPWIIPYSAWTGYGIGRKDIARYRALDPAAWLKHENVHHIEREGRKTIIIRLEESKASYIANKRLVNVRMIDAVVDELRKSADILILCRYSDQIAYAKNRYGGRTMVAEKVFDGVSLIKSANLFIGAGGTMSAEAALLGVPTISIAPIRFYIEDYLVRRGLIAKASDSKTVVRLAKKMLSDARSQKSKSKKAERVLTFMEDPTDRIIDVVTSKIIK